MITKILALAERLPSGLNDPRAAEKMLRERDELAEALAADDYVGALTEGADAVYYAVKHLDWTARQLGLSIEELFALAEAKYTLRARSGNPKDDAAERVACSAVVESNYRSHPAAYIGGPNTELVAKVYNEDDAAIIAAAPALLAELEKVTSCLAYILGAFDDGWVSEDDWILVWDAREAIALVKGK